MATAPSLRPVHLAGFPDKLATIITKTVSAARLTVEAALTGDRNLFIEALLVDYAVHDRQTACALMEIPPVERVFPASG